MRADTLPLVFRAVGARAACRAAARVRVRLGAIDLLTLDVHATSSRASTTPRPTRRRRGRRPTTRDADSAGPLAIAIDVADAGRGGRAPTPIGRRACVRLALPTRFSTLQVALVVSVAVHGALLGVRFVDPEGFNRVFEDTPLEVILVNSRSGEAPEKAQAIAQANLAGGGEAAGRPRHLAAAAVGADRDRRRQRGRAQADRAAAGDAAAAAGRRCGASWRCCRRPTRCASRARPRSASRKSGAAS